MDLETACHDLREPGVIDEKLIYSAIIDQGPKGEEGRLFKQQGVVFEEVSYLRLDFSAERRIVQLYAQLFPGIILLSQLLLPFEENKILKWKIKNLLLSWKQETITLI